MQKSDNSSFLISTLQELVRINSVNPSLAENGPGEEEIGHYIADHLKKLNITTEIDRLGKGRINVTGIIKGTGNGRSIMLNAHMDTVDVTHMKDPFSARIEDRKLYGRGAQDMKASIAAILFMAKKIQDNKVSLSGDIILSFVADEEYNSIGTEHALKKYHTDGAIVTEPTDLNICIAHKGFGLFEVVTNGRAAHGGLPKEGIDANTHMATVMQELSLLRANKKGPMVTSLCDAFKTTTGKNANFIGHSWWEDSALISDKGIDTVIFGPTGHGLHSAVEWVDIPSVATMTDILYKTVTHYCNQTKE